MDYREILQMVSDKNRNTEEHNILNKECTEIEKHDKNYELLQRKQ